MGQRPTAEQPFSPMTARERPSSVSHVPVTHQDRAAAGWIASRERRPEHPRARRRESTGARANLGAAAPDRAQSEEEEEEAAVAAAAQGLLPGRRGWTSQGKAELPAGSTNPRLVEKPSQAQEAAPRKDFSAQEAASAGLAQQPETPGGPVEKSGEAGSPRFPGTRGRGPESPCDRVQFDRGLLVWFAGRQKKSQPCFDF